jgi:hypothetical protein
LNGRILLVHSRSNGLSRLHGGTILIARLAGDTGTGVLRTGSRRNIRLGRLA